MRPPAPPSARHDRARAAACAAAGLALVLTACVPGRGGAVPGVDRPGAGEPERARRLSVAIRHGLTPPDLARTASAALGVELRLRGHDRGADVAARIARAAAATATAGDAGADGVDVAVVPGHHAQALGRAGLLEPLRPELIPNLANLHPEAARLPHDRGNRFSVPYAWGTTGICYRADLVRRPPTSWTDLLDPPRWARGRVTMMTGDRALALPALKALGYSINTADEAGLAAAARRLLAAKRTLLAYDDLTAGERLLRGEAVLAQTRDGACPTGEPRIRFAVPREGGDLWTETMVIPRGSRDPEAAHAFIDHVLTPEVHARVPLHTGYKVPNRPAMERALARGADRPQLRMSPADLLRHEPLVDLGEDAAKYARLAVRVAEG
ncbi:MAG: spermidine/putrescine ABC transporter substrate-binding protein [Actinomycetes bacterium]